MDPFADMAARQRAQAVPIESEHRRLMNRLTTDTKAGAETMSASFANVFERGHTALLRFTAGARAAFQALGADMLADGWGEKMAAPFLRLLSAMAQASAGFFLAQGIAFSFLPGFQAMGAGMIAAAAALTAVAAGLDASVAGLKSGRQDRARGGDARWTSDETRSFPLVAAPGAADRTASGASRRSTSMALMGLPAGSELRSSADGPVVHIAVDARGSILNEDDLARRIAEYTRRAHQLGWS